MTTISSASPSPVTAQRLPPPPRGPDSDRMAETIGSEVASGALSGADATALTNALGAIRSSLASGGAPAASTSDTAGAAGSRRDPAAMRSRIDGLIAEQVGNGTLTSDQASELKNLFASHGRSTTASTETGRAQGSHEPPPGPPPGDAETPGDARADGPSDDLASGSSASAADALSTFVKQLQSSQQNRAGYGAGGTPSGAAGAAAILLDFHA
ncbi:MULTISPECIES: hypothetical protein [Methylobacterium]|jgi:hypothetical protein|uniref:hypothetical protein n=1 Tax=Methylobacterium TaxID=407 RepID=UPI0008EA7605|nr:MULTISPECIES: hypothetical protein [Methylobacterium]MBZ6416853.1 hypothetical protein [Methylobacterium sp.]MBK3396499.1 hypothetical protein [Methylobacterium ajmalii]MBK3411014.1 hypothetical protein [Methylobacterium ajmalii]MBK3422347.1 hypothetical protein [Methylobacterium ajmalii]SFE80244.1 hypothetical protein SAMN04487844_10639 [Methylobacterium sp. yr596]